MARNSPQDINKYSGYRMNSCIVIENIENRIRGPWQYLGILGCLDFGLADDSTDALRFNLRAWKVLVMRSPIFFLQSWSTLSAIDSLDFSSLPTRNTHACDEHDKNPTPKPMLFHHPCPAFIPSISIILP
jgi:hypothetical protein